MASTHAIAVMASEADRDFQEALQVIADVAGIAEPPPRESAQGDARLQEVFDRNRLNAFVIEVAASYEHRIATLESRITALETGKPTAAPAKRVRAPKPEPAAEERELVPLTRFGDGAVSLDMGNLGTALGAE